MVCYNTAYDSVYGLRAELHDNREVIVRWNPPISRPNHNQYMVSVSTVSISRVVQDSSFIVQLPPGVHTIQVFSCSEHYLSEPQSTSVTVRGECILYCLTMTPSINTLCQEGGLETPVHPL